MGAVAGSLARSQFCLQTRFFRALELRARTQESMAAFVHLVNMPMLFTSTALVPTRQMPDWLAQVAAWNPLTLAVDGWRGAWLGGASVGATQVLALLGLALFFYAWAAYELGRAESA